MENGVWRMENYEWKIYNEEGISGVSQRCEERKGRVVNDYLISEEIQLIVGNTARPKNASSSHTLIIPSSRKADGMIP